MSDTEICSYADDIILYVKDMTLTTMLPKLEKDTPLLSMWFSNNSMRLNKDQMLPLSIRSKRPGIDDGSWHVDQLCMKARQKLCDHS